MTRQHRRSVKPWLTVTPQYNLQCHLDGRTAQKICQALIDCNTTIQLTVPLPPLVWWPWSWGSAARRWRAWDAAEADPADLRRLWLWSSWPPLNDETSEVLEGLPMLRLSAISSKSSSDRWLFPLKRLLMKNSCEGSSDSDSLCPWPSWIQYPCTRCRMMLAQAFSKLCWSRIFSPSSWCSPPCSSSSWSSSSSISLMMLSAEKH